MDDYLEEIKQHQKMFKNTIPEREPDLNNFLTEIKSFQKIYHPVFLEGETPPAEEKESPTNEPKTPEEGVEQTKDEFGGAGDDTGFGTDIQFGEEGQLTASEIGKVYTIKQLYFKLKGLSKLLEENNDVRLLPLKNKVLKSIDMFQLVINNYETYKEKIDQLIIIFYRFIERTTKILNKYFELRKRNLDNYDAAKNSISDDGEMEVKAPNYSRSRMFV